MKNILFILCLCFSLQTFAQYDWTEGTLYLKDGTVKEGLIKFPKVSKDLIAFNGKQKVRFKKSKKEKKEKFDHTQVAKIVFTYADSETAIYQYIAVSEKMYQLFKVITEGNITLYARTVSYTTSSAVFFPGTLQPVTYDFNDFDEFYILKKGEKIALPLITMRISRSFKKRALEYFADCPRVVAKLKDKSYREQDVRTVVRAYNYCKQINNR
ncbi:hypothetical protein H2O64_11435 [Kordia sp. YSTF-M3]|uniref:Uncharacterized protein n=1 Tax=Kordia aestuariivivens TaxID=2759037 RepID=A0ABR7Q9P7_9FLAO|nr:hypothetical protein [Kordia aestuariivivens]MBC8755290.1 hypothetical protein [Kordia aestuariivivens]